MGLRVVAVSDRPDLALLVARWRVDAFSGREGGWAVVGLTTAILAPPVGPEENLVLFDGDRPAGTAGLVRADLVRADLAARPGLTPWFTGLFVEPAFRGRGHGEALVRWVEAFARAASVPVPWLHTGEAEPFYAHLGWRLAAAGWRRAGAERDGSQEVAPMTRSLSEGRYASGANEG